MNFLWYFALLAFEWNCSLIFYLDGFER